MIEYISKSVVEVWSLKAHWFWIEVYSSFGCCYECFDVSSRSVLCYDTFSYVLTGSWGARACFKLSSDNFSFMFDCWCNFVFWCVIWSSWSRSKWCNRVMGELELWNLFIAVTIRGTRSHSVVVECCTFTRFNPWSRSICWEATMLFFALVVICSQSHRIDWRHCSLSIANAMVFPCSYKTMPGRLSNGAWIEVSYLYSFLAIFCESIFVFGNCTRTLRRKIDL